MLIEFQNKAAEIVMNYSMHLTLVSGVLAALTFIIIAKARRRKFLDDLGVKKLPANLIPVLILLGASLNIFVSLALNLIPFPQEWIDSYTESASQLSNGGLIVSTIVTVITAPIVEEMTFRGYMYKGLKTGMPMFAAMLISSWVFGLVHGEVIWVIYASLLGLVFTWTTEKCGSLLASMIVHMTFNLFGVLTQYVGEMSEWAFWLLLVSSAIAALAAVVFINRSSDRKIEFSMKPAENTDGQE